MHRGQIDKLLTELDGDSRRTAFALESAGKLPRGFVEQHYPLTRTELLSLQRLATAWRMATDVESLRDLLLGVPIDPSRVKKGELDKALTASLVQLVRPIDVLHGRAS